MIKLMKFGAAAVAAVMFLGGFAAQAQVDKTRVFDFLQQPQGAKSWMSSDVANAWKQGYKGQGVSVTVIDSFNSGKISGKMDGKVQSLAHGAWTSKEVQLIAPSAKVYTKDFSTQSQAVKLYGGLNVLNLSYGMFVPNAYKSANIRWAPAEASIIAFAKTGRAVVAKAAGNDGIAIGAANRSGNVDVLNTALTGTASTLFVGALSRNGTPTAKASMASYSNTAGTNAAVQNNFLVVGVDSAQMGLAGTSFAAPIVSGYAAIVGSKFKTATPVQITNLLLDTARTDTILNYNVAIHGQGEASIARALAPRSLK
jgi:subtilisin family serine protease